MLAYMPVKHVNFIIYYYLKKRKYLKIYLPMLLSTENEALDYFNLHLAYKPSILVR